MSFHKVSSFLNIPHATVDRFSEYLQTTCLVFFITKFSFSLKEQEKAQRKVYSIDSGLSNAIGFRFARNSGKLMENIVAIQLKIRQSFEPGIEIYYWKDQSGREVDFLVKDGLKVSELIQVCQDMSDMGTKEREVKGLIRAMEEFNIKKAIIITEEFEGDEKVRNNEIIYVPLWKWLLIG